MDLLQNRPMSSLSSPPCSFEGFAYSLICPLLTFADKMNMTNEVNCGRKFSSGLLWPSLQALKPSRGRRALLVTVSRCSLCDFMGNDWEAGLDTMQYDLVMVGGGNENWGFFSEHVENRSVAWGNMENSLKKCRGMTWEDFHRFMDHPRLLLWVTNQHHARQAVHRKILSLPLGIKGPAQLFENMLRNKDKKKIRLLLINNSGWKHRTGINTLIASKFDGVRGNEVPIEAYAASSPS
mmetsp:Transcript_9817/g.27802  ORF Transcript_9817/g.27802 Transcript_9817/m.27802 type:complete len:237 (+) Transcript_9817:540-1250(+)